MEGLFRNQPGVNEKDCPMMVKEPTEEAPCQQACPAGIDVPRYVRLVSRRKFDEALAVIREKIPFPSVCGHVCFHPCEAKCRLGEMVGSPIAINALKRFVTEQTPRVNVPWSPIAQSTGKRVAVVGSGPAGLTAAYHLATLGHSVSVFESLPEPGGMMRYGIPGYRLPRDVLNNEIDELEKVGVEIKVSSRVESLDSLFDAGSSAVLLALGAHKGIPMGVSGEDSPGVRECISFLREVNSGNKVEVGNRVGVVGGGNAAIDGARTALRLGAKQVTIVYRRTRDEMPASSEEVEAALQEGAEIMFLAAPTKITNQNGVVKVECLRMRLGKIDASGRRRPEPIKGSEFEMEFDTLIAAIGQQPNIPDGLGLVLDSGGTIVIDKDTMMTSRKGVFAGGDVVTGPASVIEAIAAGRRAVISIDRYLGGSGVIEQRLAPVDEMITLLESAYPTYTATRAEIPSLPITERLTGFSEAQLNLPSETAIEEARRCLRCGLPMMVNPEQCRVCYMCQLVCSLSHEGTFNPSKAYIKISRVVKPDGGLDVGISFTDKCDSCGLCSRYCTYGALLAGGVGVCLPVAGATSK